MNPLGIFTFALGLYALSITGWYQHDSEKSRQIEAVLERTILQQEKLLMEMENAPPVECVSVRPYTYDQWVTSKPCPPGKRGPLCHMDESDYE